jgi:hypothetical protein
LEDLAMQTGTDHVGLQKYTKSLYSVPAYTVDTAVTLTSDREEDTVHDEEEEEEEDNNNEEEE